MSPQVSKYDNSLEKVIIKYYNHGNYSQKEVVIKAMKNGHFEHFKDIV